MSTNLERFQGSSYGYRPGRKQHDCLDALGRTIQQKRVSYVAEAGIKSFFDNPDWNLVLRAVRFHTDEKWLHLYIERWLHAPVEMGDGSVVERTKGSPQGSVLSPLIANLFTHHAFDDWMRRNHPNIQLERYVDEEDERESTQVCRMGPEGQKPAKKRRDAASGEKTSDWASQLRRHHG